MLRTSDSYSLRIAQPGEAPTTLCANCYYQAGFEVYLIETGGLGEHNVSAALLESSRKHHSMAWFYVGSHKDSNHFWDLGSLLLHIALLTLLGSVTVGVQRS